VVLEALSSGALGYIVKAHVANELLRCCGIDSSEQAVCQ
jgi:hypothetical protein